MQYKNLNNGKIAKYIKQDSTHIWIRIDGVVVPVKICDFDKHYEEYVFISEFEVL